MFLVRPLSFAVVLTSIVCRSLLPTPASAAFGSVFVVGARRRSGTTVHERSLSSPSSRSSPRPTSGDDDDDDDRSEPPPIVVDEDSNRRRRLLLSTTTTAIGVFSTGGVGGVDAAWAAGVRYPPIDVNNAVAREFTAYPGLYPTVGTKIVKAAKERPFASKKDVYASLDTDAERERLRLYDSSIQVKKVDKALQQFKGSQICKYECGSRVSSSFRDEQIKAVQNARRQ